MGRPADVRVRRKLSASGSARGRECQWLGDLYLRFGGESVMEAAWQRASGDDVLRCVGSVGFDASRRRFRGHELHAGPTGESGEAAPKRQLHHRYVYLRRGEPASGDSSSSGSSDKFDV